MDTNQRLHINNFSCHRLKREDLDNVIRWRMSPHVTQFMNTDPTLTIESQCHWFDKLSSTGEFYHWLVEVDNVPCGVINLTDMDMTNKRCKWGYYIAETKLRSFQLALSLEMSLYDYVFDKMCLRKIVGESFCINTAAIKMHELCGCKIEGVLRKHIFKNGEYYDVCIQSILAEEWQIIRCDFEYQRIDFK